jgi:xanthine dehydrogenase accessory factor
MNEETKLYEEILRLKAEGTPCGLAILVQTSGSSPQKVGAKMIVRPDGTTLGTVGGGGLESEVVQACLESIRSGRPKTLDMELEESHGHVCGGRVLVYVEPVLPAPRLVIFGAGHVGKALSTLGRFCGFRVTVVDDRVEFASAENLPDAHQVLVSPFQEACSQVTVNDNTYIVIATRGHAHDFEVLESVLKAKARYIGMVGSKNKRDTVFRHLQQKGFGPEEIQGVRTPVGLEIGSVTPREIAVSIMAEIIQCRRAPESSGSSGSARTRPVQGDGAT